MENFYDTFHIEEHWKRYSILCVDDDYEFLEYLERVLEPFFLKISTAASADLAKDILSREVPDIMICDVYMPTLNGIEFVKTLRNQGNNTAIIMLSACFEKDFLQGAVSLGLEAYIVKPATLSEIFSALKRCITGIKKRENSSLYMVKSGIIIDLNQKTATNPYTENSVIFTKKELGLLELLIKHKKMIVAQATIAESLWQGEEISASCIKTLVKKLRDKLGEEVIKTYRNIGYMIVMEEE